jgi:hypothetical protein
MRPMVGGYCLIPEANRELVRFGVNGRTAHAQYTKIVILQHQPEKFLKTEQEYLVPGTWNRATTGQNCEALPALDAIGFEVVVVDGEDET